MAKNSKSNLPKELSDKDLRWECPLSEFNFQSTKELTSLEEIIGQERALEALRMGAKITSHGYNIFVSGLSGTGRLTTVKKILEDLSNARVATFDYCYVNNFQNPDEPKLLKFKSGFGRAFSKAMDDTILFLKRRIPQLFEEEGFQATRRSMVKKFQEQDKSMLENFNLKIKPFGLVVGQLELENEIATPAILLTVADKMYTIDDLDSLIEQKIFTEEKAKEIHGHFETAQDEFVDFMRSEIKITQELQRSLLEHDKLAAGVLVKTSFDELRNQFSAEGLRVMKYIADVEEHFLQNIQIFSPDIAVKTPDGEQVATIANVPEEALREDGFDIYKVNVILDNSDTEFPPVIIETTPSFVNLFGSIEKKFDARGFWKTGFTHIKSGALLKADGGYLILNALDVFEEGVWKALKRVLLHGKLEIQPIDSYFQISQTLIKPEAIELNIKIILIGDDAIYQQLYVAEEDFKKIFKVNAVFDFETKISNEMFRSYAMFTHKICEEEHLLHFDKTGVAALVENAVKLAGRRGVMTLIFSDIADVIREASYYASESSSRIVRHKDVECALEKRQWRNNLIDIRIRNYILDGTLLIDTEGERVGQINGLTIYSTGLISFGKPARITVTVGAGSHGIINIEREIELSGSSHDKGVLILSGILRERFARKQPISLSSSITFEQNYDEIDGDSASSAETYCLLSALSGVPIKQSLAVTGSINQKGDVQPIGGVNEKIEGFFDICLARGLTGNQGVLIPIQNVNDLMLNSNVVEAVRKKQFHIYPVSKLEEGIEILTGIPAGVPNEEGIYPPDTIFGKVTQTLFDLHKSMRGFILPETL